MIFSLFVFFFPIFYCFFNFIIFDVFLWTGLPRILPVLHMASLPFRVITRLRVQSLVLGSEIVFVRYKAWRTSDDHLWTCPSSHNQNSISERKTVYVHTCRKKYQEKTLIGYRSVDNTGRLVSAISTRTSTFQWWCYSFGDTSRYSNVMGSRSPVVHIGQR